jgi:hypothetical protein
MKSFKEWIGESKKESGRPQLDEILSRADRLTPIIDWLESNLGSDFLEFSLDSPVGEKIAQEFQSSRYLSFYVSKDGLKFYYYTDYTGIDKPFAVRTEDRSTWWIGKNTLDTIDPNWSIDSILADF